MQELLVLDTAASSPEALVQEHSDQLEVGGERLLFIRYPFEQYWLSEKPVLQLGALVKIAVSAQDVMVQFTVTDQLIDLTDYLNNNKSAAIDFSAICQRFSLPYFFIGQPITLMSVNIPKPWGQEIWFTGIEERGVSMASRGDHKLPLPWVLSVFPKVLCAQRQRSLVLLKILDPLPEAVVGDLYFELHEEKREVYVVTAVDQGAWPDEVGEIRYGVDQNVRKQYGSDEKFRSEFLGAVKAYEIVRRKIDSLLDAFENETGEQRPLTLNELTLNEKKSPALSSYIPDQLLTKEKKLRHAMESFTGRLPLKVGDVVKVPCLIPHSLQHGVRTVEFQTPVYERLIVSFAQKVLTQNHWDTQRAVELMALGLPQHDDIENLLEADGVRIDRVVDFGDFSVRRIVIKSGSQWFLASSDIYTLCMPIEGELIIGESTVEPEQAVLLTPAWLGAQIKNKNEVDISFLLADPK
jgi:hypothetical protein